MLPELVQLTGVRFVGTQLPQDYMLKTFFFQIFISYVDNMTPTDLRQNEIFEKYYFVCQCPRCTDENETKKMIAAECANPKCDNVLDLRSSVYMCPICEKEVPVEHQEMYTYLMEFTPLKLYEMAANDTACKF